MRNLDRISWLFLVFALCWLILLVRSFQIQVLDFDKYNAKANFRAQTNKIQTAPRGRILDRNGMVLAQSIEECIDECKGEEKESKDKEKPKEPKKDSSRVETRRVYPEGTLAAQILGKLNRAGEGSSGLELYFDSLFRGTDGWVRYVKDANQKIQAGRIIKSQNPIPGLDLVLTIDGNIQEIVEHALKEGVEKVSAKSGSAVIVDPYTGEILAMATYPTFDPNAPLTASSRVKSDIVSMPYEPGSTFKAVTASTAIETHSVNPETVFSGEKGKWNAGNGIIIHDDNGRDHGDHNMTGAMAVSSNIIFAKIADSIGKEKFYRYLLAFGYGNKTQVELPGEESGQLKKTDRWSGRTGKTIGYGHEILVTPIQMAMSYAAIANGGTLYKPTLVKEWRTLDGEVVKRNSPEKIRNVISASTAARVRAMLREVVETGTGKQVKSEKIPGIQFGGKTGTAIKFKSQRYDASKTVASFIGLAPAENPRYVCMVLVDEPGVYGKTSGGAAAGPIFRNIMEGIYYSPESSPVPYNLRHVSVEDRCNVEFVGLSSDAAKNLAESRRCLVTFDGEGKTVVAQERDFADGGLVLRLGVPNAQRMPNLVGLSLRDAIEQIGELSGEISYEGTGRVKKQIPEPNALLRRGEKFKLVLSEKG
jgi:cell division protein FtsI (penicillin-binding protein 3)